LSFSETVSLQKGWNLLGVDSNLSLPELQTKIGIDNLLVIQGQKKTYQKSYVDLNKSFLNDFTALEEGAGYWIKVENNVSFDYSKITYNSEQTIALKSGWNLINALSDLNLISIITQLGVDNLEVIQGANKTYKKAYVDINKSFLNDFKNFEEPTGYWVKVKNDALLRFSFVNRDELASINIAHKFGKATQPPQNGYYYYKPPENAIDGNLNTNNHTQCSAPDNWLQVELPDATKVNKIVIHNITGQSARLNGSTVYLSNRNYTGSQEINSNEALATLNANMIQTIEPSILEENRYLLIKGNPEGTNSCLHLSEVEVYGETPVTPIITEHESSYLIKGSSLIGDIVTTINGVDYQDDELIYSINNSAFSIDANGVIRVNSALQSGVYNVTVTISDGVNAVTGNLTINVTTSTAVADALSSGSVIQVTEEELIQAARDEISSLKGGNSLLSQIYQNGSISYTSGNYHSQLIKIYGDVKQVFPILYGN
jgi:hypothetical protein